MMRIEEVIKKEKEYQKLTISNQKKDNKVKRFSRKNFTEQQKKILNDWISKQPQNKAYANRIELNSLMEKTKLSSTQIRVYLTNYRCRAGMTNKNVHKRDFKSRKLPNVIC